MNQMVVYFNRGGGKGDKIHCDLGRGGGGGGGGQYSLCYQLQQYSLRYQLQEIGG